MQIEDFLDDLVNIRHRLHSMAELSGEERETSREIHRFLTSTDPDQIITGIGGAGIMAKFSGDKPGPSLLIRCELDALPIPEDNDVDYISQNEETGHKCGHDGHMAIVCGVAKMLSEEPLERGEVFLLFQPAEETGEGAKRVLNDEKFKNIHPDFVFALHNLPGFGKHQIVVRPGTFAAASVGLIIRLKGETSHAAHPEEGRSPALAVAQLIQSLSALPQFNAPLEKAAKATIIHARLGEKAFGTSPGYARLMATLRTFEDETLKHLKKRALQIARGIAETYDLEIDTEWVEPFPATRNDDKAVDTIKKVAVEHNFEIFEKNEPFSWSEDFGHFTRAWKGAIFGLGAGKDQPVLHASDYDFPDDIIKTGILMFKGIIDRCTSG